MPPAARNPQWYERDGLQFECTRCGRCCKRPGFVLVTNDEAERIAERIFGTDAATVAAQQGLWRRLISEEGWTVDVAPGTPCPLLGADDRCSVHDIKPSQCAQYPFWYEVIEARVTWALEGQECEGIGKGRKWSAEEIDSIMRGGST